MLIIKIHITAQKEYLVVMAPVKAILLLILCFIENLYSSMYVMHMNFYDVWSYETSRKTIVHGMCNNMHGNKYIPIDHNIAE